MATQFIHTCDHCGQSKEVAEKGANGWVNLTMHTTEPTLYLSFDICGRCFGDPNNLLLVIVKVRGNEHIKRIAERKKWQEQGDAQIDASLKRLGHAAQD